MRYNQFIVEKIFCRVQTAIQHIFNRSPELSRFVAERNAPAMIWSAGLLVIVYSLFFYTHYVSFIFNDSASLAFRRHLLASYLFILIVGIILFALSLLIRQNFDTMWRLNTKLVYFVFVFFQFIGLVELYCSLKIHTIDYFFWLITTLLCLCLLYVPPILFTVVMAIMSVIFYQILIPAVGFLVWKYLLILIIVTVALNFTRFYGVSTMFQQTRETEAHRERADIASSAKNAFLANMSHEIRTPINAVLGMDELILRESNNDRITEYAYNIKESGKTLLSLINDILDFTRIESGKMEIIPAEYEIASTLNDLINMVSTRMDEKGVELHLNISESIPHILYGDEIRVKQAVSNLLTNAVKYTPRGSITFSVDWEHTANSCIVLIFSVADTGIGIKKDDLERIATQFERLEERRNRSIEGTGLGLSITKLLMDLMNGQFFVESEYGKGSVFTLRIPQQILTTEPVGNFRQRYSDMIYMSGKAKKVGTSFIAPECRVLIVDDNAINLKVIEGLLKSYKLQIVVALSGADALKILDAAYARNVLFSLVFMDHLMPNMDGIEATNCIRQREGAYFKNLPVIALTATALQGSREMFLEAGMQDFVAKPVDVKNLEDTLLKWLPADKVITR